MGKPEEKRNTQKRKSYIAFNSSFIFYICCFLILNQLFSYSIELEMCLTMGGVLFDGEYHIWRLFCSRSTIPAEYKTPKCLEVAVNDSLIVSAISPTITFFFFFRILMI